MLKEVVLGELFNFTVDDVRKSITITSVSAQKSM
jgi:hypothetical protein